MKKLVASVGLVALGASGLQAAELGGLDPNAKPWSVAVSLRGFYDDNVNTSPNTKQGSFGFEVSPSVGLHLNLEQTSIRLGYAYSLKYYDHQPIGNTDHFDQTHSFNAALEHSFNERYQVAVQDSFVIGQEPDTLRAGNTPLSTFQRIPGSNIRNYGSITLTAQLTPVFGLQAGYANSLFDYDDSGAGTNTTGTIDQVSPSLSGLLDRVEHSAWLDTRWRFMPETTIIVGGRWRDVSYTGNEFIQGAVDNTGEPVVIMPFQKSQSRDFREYSGYVGAEHTFQPTLSGSLKAGASYVDYYNDPGTTASWRPYAVASLRWTYSPDNTLEVGVTHDVNATDVLGFGGTHIAQSAESTVVYANLSHHITQRIVANATGQFQHSVINGGQYNSDSERYFLAGINVEYRFTPNFAAQAGYNYDRLDSDIPNRSFDRNRVYIGVTAGY